VLSSDSSTGGPGGASPGAVADGPAGSVPAFQNGCRIVVRASFSDGLFAVRLRRDHVVVLPVVIVAAFGVALVARWWAVPLVATGWGVLVAGSLDAGGYAGVLAVAAVNAFVGAVLGVGITRALRARGTPPSSHA
jgi:hypothetical protein